MGYQVLARKLRPKSFSEVWGQSHIIRSLSSALETQKIGHAYLFCGTRGTGKTSVARLFAKALACNDLQSGANACGKCSSCLDISSGSSFDVIEMDGASHNGVEDIRELIDRVQYLPSKGKRKVYVIDEVHMLSTSAFNALLKTLEEPPEHVVFIFATTNPEKLIRTVVSRCQRFDFKQLPQSELVKFLESVVESEGLRFESRLQLEKIARLGEGSVRDTLSILDQVLTYALDDLIDDRVLTEALGIAGRGALSQLSRGILFGNSELVKEVYSSLINENISAEQIASGVLDLLFEVIESIDSKSNLVSLDILQENEELSLGFAELFWIFETLTKDFQWSLNSLNAQKFTEVAILKVTFRDSFFKSSGQSLTLKPLGKEKEEPASKETVKPVEAKVEKEVEPIKETVQVKEIVIEKTKIEITEPESEPSPSRAEPEAEVSEPSFPKTWEGFLDFVRTKSPALVANLEQGNTLDKVKFGEELLDLEVAFPLAAKVFFEYVKEAEVESRLKSYLVEFFQIKIENLSLSLKLLDEEKRKTTGFQSRQEIRDKNDLEDREKRRQDILAQDSIIMAKGLFNSDVDKVILNETTIGGES